MTQTKRNFPVSYQVRLLSDGDPIVDPLDIYAISRQGPSHARVCQNQVKREGDEQGRVFGEEQQFMMPKPAREHTHYAQMEARQRQQQRTRNADALAWARRLARTPRAAET